MTQISRYIIDTKVTGSDKWIGSDSETQNTTKNFTPNKLSVYFNENQVIDIGTPIRYKYDILQPLDSRERGTITFDPQVGTPYNFSSITNFILSKYTLKGNDVSNYLNFLIGKKILICKANDVNTFGYYNLISLVPNILEPNFFDVTLSYITGNGSIVEDDDYLISLIDGSSPNIPTRTSDLINDGENGVNPFISALALTPYLLSSTAASTYFPIPTGTTLEYIRGNGTLATFPSTPTITPSALTKVDDTNVTLTLGGTPSTALLQGVSLTLGWTGTLADSRIASASNWNTAYTNRIVSLTTTGSSGSASLISNTLNIPTYTLSGLGGVPTSRTLTINGTAYDLSADRSWTVGTITSVSATGPITSSGGTTPTISTSMATNKLIGRSTAGIGVMEEITIGTGLTLSAGTLSATATGGGIPHATASGTDTYTATVTGVTSYADGDTYLIRFTNGNTTVCTLNINALGAIPLYRNNDGQLIGGDIISGGEMLCVYNSTTNVFQCIGTAPNTLLSYVTNADSVTLTKGMVVYAFGGTGDRMTVKRASNNGDSTSAQTVGLVLSTSIAANQKGIIIMQGLLDGLSILPTSTFADGDPVYLGSTAGSITKIKPYAPNHLVYLGVVTTASPGASGRMYVKVQNGYELDELHNVQAQSPTLKDTLWYDNTVTPAQWKTASISTILGYTPFNLPSLTSGSVLFSNGTTIAQDNANFFWDDTNNRLGIGTNIPTNILDVVKNQDTPTRVNIENKDALGTSTLRFTNLGGAAAALFENSSNQFTFQNATNGGVLRFQTTNSIGNTLTALTVDGDQNIGIGMTIPTTKLDVNGVITATGGNSTSWNAKQNAITLTTTGSSGSSTFISNTLNVPTYTLSGLGGVPYVGATNDLDLGSNDIYANEYNFYDPSYLGYGRINLSAEEFWFTTTPTSVVARITYGTTILVGTNFYSAKLVYTGLTADRVYTFPNASGTIALTSDIPSLTGYVQTTRTISTTSPLQGGGDLSANRTLSILEANASQNGYLSSANWSTFNAKQDALTLTTTGTSGPATLVGSTLNIPQYSGGGGSTPVKLTSQTLAVGSWTLSGGYYTYAFSNVNVTTTCDVSVTPQNASYQTAYNANVLPFVGVAAGVATFYSQFPPQANMVVDIVITQTT